MNGICVFLFSFHLTIISNEFWVSFSCLHQCHSHLLFLLKWRLDVHPSKNVEWWIIKRDDTVLIIGCYSMATSQPWMNWDWTIVKQSWFLKMRIFFCSLKFKTIDPMMVFDFHVIIQYSWVIYHSCCSMPFIHLSSSFDLFIYFFWLFF